MCLEYCKILHEVQKDWKKYWERWEGSTRWSWRKRRMAVVGKTSKVIHSRVQVLSRSCTQCTLAVSVWLFMETGSCILPSSAQQTNKVMSGAFGASFWVVVNCWASFCMSSAMRKRKVQTSSGRSGTVCLDPWSPCIPRGLLAVLCVLPLHLPFVAQLPWGQDALHICSLSQKSMTWASYQPVLMLWASSIFTAPQGILWFV